MTDRASRIAALVKEAEELGYAIVAKEASKPCQFCVQLQPGYAAWIPMTNHNCKITLYY